MKLVDKPILDNLAKTDDLLHQLQDVAENLTNQGWLNAADIVYGIVEDIAKRSGV